MDWPGRLFANLVSSSHVISTGTGQVASSAGYSTFSACGDGIQCGYVIVPENYASPHNGIANISLTRISATKHPSMGTVFVNAGGPGIGGNWVAGSKENLVEHLGRQWDIVGFDPRGIGASTPTVHCFASEQDQINLYTGSVFEHGYTYPHMSEPDSPENRPVLASLEREHVAVFKAQSEACKRNMNVNDLRFTGSMTVARDIEFMSRILEGDKSDINFYGYSYGTVIGAYLVNMFPQRIGRVTLDGVVDIVDVSDTPTNQWANTFLVSQEETYHAFLGDCAAAGPSKCPLANQINEDTNVIDHRIEAFTQSLVDEPLSVADPPGVLTAGAIRNLFVNALYSPSSWPTFSQQLADALAGNGSALFTTLRSGIASAAQLDASRFAVICADSPRLNLTAQNYADDLIAALKVSRFAGGLIYTDPDGGCETWPIQPIESHTGSWYSDPKNPVLIISNTADPVTPLINGRKAQNRLAYGKSSLVIQDGPGHTSLALQSHCTTHQIKSYWAGKLPKNGTICPVSKGPFSSD